MRTFRLLLLYLVSGLLLVFSSGDLAWADRGHFGGQFSARSSSQFSGNFVGHPVSHFNGNFVGHPVSRFNGNFDGHFHRHARVAVFIGAPLLFDPWFFPPVYEPPVVVVPSGDQAYVEQGDGAAPASAYWYRCDNPSGYYPYVKVCPSGWHTEVPSQ